MLSDGDNRNYLCLERPKIDLLIKTCLQRSCRQINDVRSGLAKTWIQRKIKLMSNQGIDIRN